MFVKPAERIAIIGSGLSALGALIAAKEFGVEADVYCPSQQPSVSAREQAFEKSRQQPESWHPNLVSYGRVSATSIFSPEKTLFGETPFLSKRYVATTARGNVRIPSSEGLGGMAGGWGASSLPVNTRTLDELGPLGSALRKSYERVMPHLPYSYARDALSARFDDFGAEPDSFESFAGAQSFLSQLARVSARWRSRAIVGRARLMLQVAGTDGCRGCGSCMSGCPYGSIFNPGESVARLAKESGGRFVSGIRVSRISTSKEKLVVHDDSGEPQGGQYDFVFLCCGPLPTIEILDNSTELPESLRVKAKVAVVFLGFSPRIFGHPHSKSGSSRFINTLPTAFIEKEKSVFGVPVHTQISFNNELLAGRTTAREDLGTESFKLPKLVWRRLCVLQSTIGGEGSSEYCLEKPLPHLPRSTAKYSYSKRVNWARLTIFWIQTFLEMLSAGIILLPIVKRSPAFHLGAVTSRRELAFGVDGHSTGLKNLFVADTSTLPFLPSETLGLTASANGYRVVEQGLSSALR